MHTRTNRLTLLAALACAALPATSTITISAHSPDAGADRDWTRYDRNAPPRPPRPGTRAARRRKLARRR